MAEKEDAMKSFSALLLLFVLACGGEATEEDGQDEAELGSVQQPTIAACLKDGGNLQYGNKDQQVPWVRCDPSASMTCNLPGLKKSFEMAMDSNSLPWSAGDKLEWSVGGQNAAQFLYNTFTAWQGQSTKVTRLNTNTFNTEIPGVLTSIQLTAELPDYIELRKKSLTQPSWYANRANTTSAKLTDLATLRCVANVPLTDSNNATWRRCTRWTALIDYDRMRGWTLARGVSVQPLIEAVVKKLGVWAMGLAPGSGSGGTVTDANVYVSGPSSLTNPTSFVNGTFGSEVAWVNNYSVNGQTDANTVPPTGERPAIQACFNACGAGFNAEPCYEACRRVLHCELE